MAKKSTRTRSHQMSLLRKSVQVKKHKRSKPGRKNTRRTVTVRGHSRRG